MPPVRRASDSAVAIGEGTRIQAPLAPLVARHLHEMMSRRDDLVFTCLSRVNRAHVVMLREAGIVSAPDAKAILSALTDLDRLGWEALSDDYVHGEIFTHVEQYVMERAGPPGGNLHIGRSRGDLFVTTYRLYVRTRLLDVARALVDLRTNIHRLAAAHVRTTMPSYTHGQTAQFITFGHYLSGALGAFERDGERLIAAHGRVNRSSLGTGVGAGSSWPLDRSRTAALLGFESLNLSAFDAVCSQDYLIEAVACCVANAANHLVLLTDLHTWSTSEVGFIELDDEFCASSSLMPQKKNPMGLEVARSTLSRVYGAQAELLATHKVDNVMERCIYGFPPTRQALDTTVAMLDLTAAMIATLTIDDARMLESARRSFAGAAELANMLTRECGLSFRHSHRVVGTLVRQAVDRGISPADVGNDLVAQAAEQTLGHTVTCSADQVRSSLSPEAVVSGIRTAGGANPEETSKVLAATASRLEADRAALAILEATAADADRELDQRTREIVAKPG